MGIDFHFQVLFRAEWLIGNPFPVGGIVEQIERGLFYPLREKKKKKTFMSIAQCRKVFFLLNSGIKMTCLFPFAKSIFSLSQPKGTTWYFQVSIKHAFPSAGAGSNNRPYGTLVHAKWRRIASGIKYIKVSLAYFQAL